MYYLQTVSLSLLKKIMHEHPITLIQVRDCGQSYTRKRKRKTQK